jgi:hypothetical protein
VPARSNGVEKIANITQVSERRSGRQSLENAATRLRLGSGMVFMSAPLSPQRARIVLSHNSLFAKRLANVAGTESLSKVFRVSRRATRETGF